MAVKEVLVAEQEIDIFYNIILYWSGVYFKIHNRGIRRCFSRRGRSRVIKEGEEDMINCEFNIETAKFHPKT